MLSYVENDESGGGQQSTGEVVYDDDDDDYGDDDNGYDDHGDSDADDGDVDNYGDADSVEIIFNDNNDFKASMSYLYIYVDHTLMLVYLILIYTCYSIYHTFIYMLTTL